MKDCKLKLENGMIVDVDYDEKESYRLYIPKEVRSIVREVLLDVEPAVIEAEEGGTFTAKGNCLLKGETLAFGCPESHIPADGSVTNIADSAFAFGMDYPESLANLTLPDSIRRIGYNAFSGRCEQPVSITLPEGLRTILPTAFRIHAPSVTLTFHGDTVPEIGCFGTTAEIADLPADTKYPILRDIPAAVNVRPQTLLIRCKKDSRLAAYCKKYGIRTEDLQ